MLLLVELHPPDPTGLKRQIGLKGECCLHVLVRPVEAGESIGFGVLYSWPIWETLKLFEISWNGPGLDGLQLPLLHLDTLTANVIGKKLYRGLMKGALFDLEKQLVFLGSPENFIYMDLVFGLILGIDKNVINVYQNNPIQKGPEHLIHPWNTEGALTRPHGMTWYS